MSDESQRTVGRGCPARTTQKEAHPGPGDHRGKPAAGRGTADPRPGRMTGMPLNRGGSDGEATNDTYGPAS